MSRGGNSGADRFIPVARDIDRGVRSVHHPGLIGQHPVQFLRPFAIAPVRPGETLLNVDVMGDSMLEGMVQLQNMPMTWAEMGVWYVPFSRLPPEWKQLFVGDPRALIDNNAFATGTSVPIADAILDQGHETPGLQSRLRPWAGEVGGDQTTQAIESVYLPIGSHGTYAIGEDWYPLKNDDRDNNDLFQNEPIVQDYIRGATRQSFNVGTAGVDPDVSAVTSLADLLEQMFILSKVERTYAEYLADHGVNPNAAAGVVTPLMIRNQFLGPLGNTHLLGNVVDQSYGDIENTSFFPLSVQTNQMTVDPPGPPMTGVWDKASIGTLGCRWSGRNSPRIRFEEPGFVIGTIVWWSEDGSADRFGHHFDATRLTTPGAWGVRLGSGVDEEDFIVTQDLYDTLGTSIQTGEENEQGAGSNVMNMLNLWLHGDTAAPLGTSQFRYRHPFGNEFGENNIQISSRFSLQLDIMSDLVGG